MNTQVLNFSGLALAYLVLFGVCELLYRKFNWQAENTRKVAHAGSGVMALSFPHFFESPIYVTILCAAFLGILYLTKRFRLLRSIHGIARVSYGSSMFPFVVAICFWFYSRDFNLTKFYLPVLIMALADPVACLVGMRLPIMKVWGKKTLGGSGAFFMVAFGLSWLLLANFTIGLTWNAVLVRSLLIGLASTFAEMVSNKGLDNLTIPLSTLLVLSLF